jgi:hypothetical protein
MRQYRILMVGLGHLGSRMLDLFVRLPGQHTFLVGGRNVDALRERANLSMLAAIQLGYTPEVACTFLDLWNVDQTAETIARFHPDIIVCCATLRRWSTSGHLPAPLAERLASAPTGPRLPFHLPLVYRLMQAVHATGQTITVINTTYPDVVHPVLGTVGLAPTTGIGSLANNVPAIKKSLAVRFGVPVEQIDVRLVMEQYVSYWMSRRRIGDAPFVLAAFINGKEVTHHLERTTVFDPLSTTLKRTGGSPGLLMTATSAAVVLEGMVSDSGVLTHAPGPNGLPGGYPVRVNAQGVEIFLPDHLSLEAALQVNEAGLHLDGIEKIESDGTVYFSEQGMEPYRDILGYSCQRMRLSEVEQWTHELDAKYKALMSKYAS